MSESSPSLTSSSTGGGGGAVFLAVVGFEDVDGLEEDVDEVGLDAAGVGRGLDDDEDGLGGRAAGAKGRQEDEGRGVMNG
jgi:hypothetical protein